MKLLQRLININQNPTMHCQEELERDLKNHIFITNDIMFNWFEESYSTSKHLLTLYSLVRGLNANTILEIGFGRSSFVLAKATKENQGKFITCDKKDFSYLLSKEEKKVTRYLIGNSSLAWGDKELKKTGVDFAFLDYFSNEKISAKFCLQEINSCLGLLKTNGIIAIHDSFDGRFDIGKIAGVLKKQDGVETVTLPFNYGLAVVRKTRRSVYGSLQDRFYKK